MEADTQDSRFRFVDTDDVEPSDSVDNSPIDKKRIVGKTKLLKDAKKYSESLEKRGVIYMSRIPPYMKPNKARTMFEQFGSVTRIYLAEEDPEIRRNRKAGGGNGSKQFTEGWIEFEDKKIAKAVAESLNNTAIGGTKSHFYHDDIWNLKYLKNFKWDYLTEKFAYERRVREQKLRAAMMQAKRSNAEFVELVEKGKQQRHVEERKRKRIEQQGGNDDDNDALDSASNSKNVKRKFRQVAPIASDTGDHSKFVDKKLISAVFSNSKKQDKRDK
jgi:ESF2/ABP1 family protein